MEKPTAHTAVEPLDGKRILITGGTTGIGRAIALLLSSYGARIVTFGRHQEPLDETLKAIREAGGQADGFLADSASAEDIQRVFQEADAKLGGLDVLIDCAALAADSLGEMDDSATGATSLKPIWWVIWQRPKKRSEPDATADKRPHRSGGFHERRCARSGQFRVCGDEIRHSGIRRKPAKRSQRRRNQK
jgi:NAD(P)-dependent dehydrogenase (short-subunit alcohol dehydrogenase family)